MRIRIIRLVTRAIVCGLGGLLFFSGFSKIYDLGQTVAEAVLVHEILGRIPKDVWFLLPATEMVLGVCLVTKSYFCQALRITTGLFIIFSLYHVYSILFSPSLSCGCIRVREFVVSHGWMLATSILAVIICIVMSYLEKTRVVQ